MKPDGVEDPRDREPELPGGVHEDLTLAAVAAAVARGDRVIEEELTITGGAA
jgi:hypothetical protein